MKKLLAFVSAAGAAALILAPPNAQATADDYFDCLKGRNVNINLSPVYPNFLLNVGKKAAQIMNVQGVSADAVTGGLIREDMSPHLAESIVACSPEIGQLASAGTASGSTCDGAGCVPNVTQGAVPSGHCVPKRRYDFGVDSGGKPYVCLSIGSWAAAPPLVGVRTLGSRCSGELSAQSPDGLAMYCANGAWTLGDDIPR